MKDIFSELCGLLGVSYKDLEDFLKEEGVTVQVKENGKPVVDIENGVNKLKKQEDKYCTNTTKAEDKKWTSTCSQNTVKEPVKESIKEPVKTVETPVFNSVDLKSTTSADYPTSVELAKGVTLYDGGYFGLQTCVGDKFLITDPVFLNFAKETKDGWCPGITEDQLLAVLLYRFKNNPKKYELVKKLLW